MTQLLNAWEDVNLSTMHSRYSIRIIIYRICVYKRVPNVHLSIHVARLKGIPWTAQVDVVYIHTVHKYRHNSHRLINHRKNIKKSKGKKKNNYLIVTNANREWNESTCESKVYRSCEFELNVDQTLLCTNILYIHIYIYQ